MSGIERSIRGHMGRAHPEIDSMINVSVVKFNSLRPFRFTMCLMARRGQKRQRTLEGTQEMGTTATMDEDQETMQEGDTPQGAITEKDGSPTDNDEDEEEYSTKAAQGRPWKK